jgi:hypothetical protein
LVPILFPLYKLHLVPTIRQTSTAPKSPRLLRYDEFASTTGIWISHINLPNTNRHSHCEPPSYLLNMAALRHIHCTRYRYERTNAHSIMTNSVTSRRSALQPDHFPNRATTRCYSTTPTTQQARVATWLCPHRYHHPSTSTRDAARAKPASYLLPRAHDSHPGMPRQTHAIIDYFWSRVNEPPDLRLLRLASLSCDVWCRQDSMRFRSLLGTRSGVLHKRAGKWVWCMGD